MSADQLSIKQLEELLKHHKALYYQGRPEISDAEYDALEDELRRRCPQSYVLNLVGSTDEYREEKKSLALSSSSSSTPAAAKVKHQVKMLSLEKTYELAELEAWMGKHEVVTTFKLDGVSGSLIYEQGKLTLAKTRGDGTYGENITPKVLWMNSVPKVLPLDAVAHDVPNFGELIEIRGEFFCLENDFLHLAQEMAALGM